MQISLYETFVLVVCVFLCLLGYDAQMNIVVKFGTQYSRHICCLEPPINLYY